MFSQDAVSFRCAVTRPTNRMFIPADMTVAISSRCPARRGFTLAELVVVVLIMAILTAVAVPQMMKSVCYYNVEAATRRIKLDVELAQRYARKKSVSQTVAFATNTHSYTLSGVADLDHGASGYTVRLDRAPYQAELVSANFNGGGTLTFDGYGVPTSGGNVVVASGSRVRTVTIDSTGEVTIQ